MWEILFISILPLEKLNVRALIHLLIHFLRPSTNIYLFMCLHSSNPQRHADEYKVIHLLKIPGVVSDRSPGAQVFWLQVLHSL